MTTASTAVEKADAADFDAAYGWIASTPHAHEECERIVRRVFEAVLAAGDCAIDIGAGAGTHTIPMALAVGCDGHVVAIDPIDGAAGHLLNRCDALGLGGIVEVRHALGGSGVPSALATPAVGDPLAELQTLDQLVEEHGSPRFVRIAVGGSVVDVLDGSATTLRTGRPVLCLTVVPGVLGRDGSTVRDVHNRLMPLGYRLFDVLGNDVTATWEASAGCSNLVDYFAIHADDDALDVVCSILGRTFLDTRFAAALDGVPLLRPRLGQVGGGTGGLVTSVVDPPHLLRDSYTVAAGLPTALAQPTVIDAGGPQLFVTTNGATLVDIAAATLANVEQLQPCGLPIRGRSDPLPRRGGLQMTLSALNYLDGKATPLVELHWPADALTGVVRKLSRGPFETVWYRNGEQLASGSAPHFGGPIDVVVSRSGREMVLELFTARGGLAVARCDAQPADEPFLIEVGQTVHGPRLQPITGRGRIHVRFGASVRRPRRGRRRVTGAIRLRVGRAVRQIVRRSPQLQAIVRSLRSEIR